MRGPRDKELDRLRGRLCGNYRGCIATFVYPDGFKTLVADSRKDAFAQARRRWGDGWISEPCISNPYTIYRDVTGETARRHGQAKTKWSEQKQRASRLFRFGR